MESHRPPALLETYARLARADELYAELEESLGSAETVGDVSGDIAPDLGDLFGFDQGAVAAAARVRIAEIVDHLRSALDYLVFEVAGEDSGEPQSGTQFIIADTPADFARQVKRRLRGMSPENRSIIESYQPYCGYPWLAQLRDLSNPGKHQHLHVVGETGAVLVAGPNLLFTMTFVAFDDGSPVLEVLDEIRSAVQAIANRFSQASAR